MDVCIIYGPLIGVAVQVLKRIPFVRKNPKVVAAVLSVVVAVIGAGPGFKEHIAQIIQCIIGTLAGAVATYEVAVKPVTKGLKDDA